MDTVDTISAMILDISQVVVSEENKENHRELSALALSIAEYSRSLDAHVQLRFLEMCVEVFRRGDMNEIKRLLPSI